MSKRETPESNSEYVYTYLAIKCDSDSEPPCLFTNPRRTTCSMMPSIPCHFITATSETSKHSGDQRLEPEAGRHGERSLRNPACATQVLLNNHRKDGSSASRRQLMAPAESVQLPGTGDQNHTETLHGSTFFSSLRQSNTFNRTSAHFYLFFFKAKAREQPRSD